MEDTVRNLNQARLRNLQGTLIRMLRHCTSSFSWNQILNTEEKSEFSLMLRSGSCAEKGPKQYMEDEFISVDLLSDSIGSLVNFPSPAVFNGLVATRSSSSIGKGKNHEGNIKYGFSLVKRRANHPMEDYHVAKFVQLKDNKEVGLFAIYDGHLGDRVPAYLQKNLFTNILREEGFWDDPTLSISKAYESTDEAILSNSSDLGHGGSTAVTAIYICVMQKVHKTSGITLVPDVSVELVVNSIEEDCLIFDHVSTKRNVLDPYL